MRKINSTRRGILARGAAFIGAAALAGCDKVINSDQAASAFKGVDALNRKAQQAILQAQQLAPEYTEADISPKFYANGSTDPDDPAYKAMVADGFKDYRLQVTGMVDTPLSLSLADLRAMPARTQITRHDCVEGWSCIGKWTGVPLSLVLDKAGVKPTAKYLVFQCFDTMDDPSSMSGPPPFYGSIDLLGAHHPQTILAYDMNGKTLEVPFGAPLRLRLERQLGYKMTKYIKEIQLVDSFAEIGQGKGGYWEDNGYQWYAGI
ncbi:molybdopterin-binding protein [Lichenihabitans psoromatis]|uniref:molybdopterin-binding protein n=1 Tax=Lichenihabitans psoromatis TaxID=2528642 RepID=UPI0010385455|nr:molybdopterin-binding protein [Lichenihabitans psoromatis]